MEEILHHLGWLKSYKQWDKPPINWCRISSIHRKSAIIPTAISIFHHFPIKKNNAMFFMMLF